MFISCRLGRTLKSVAWPTNISYRFLKILVNKKYCIQTARISSLFKIDILRICTFPLLQKEHTTKGWKFLARDGEVPDELPHSSCEEGKDSIPHTVLISELQKCSSVASQLETFNSLLSLTPEDMEIRKNFCLSLEKAISIYFKNFRVTQFGSSVNGLGFKGCDVDVCLNTYNNEEYLMLKDVPSLSSVLDDTVSQETLARMNPKYMLHFISRILRQHCPDINKNIFHIHARCPILRFYNAKYDVFCDFSCENPTSVRNTMLLLLLSKLDERFSTVAKVIRYWGKYGGFVGDIDAFNSYAFSLFVVHFLQTRNPPVLPSIKEIIEKSEYLKSQDVLANDLLMQDVKTIPSSQNTQTSEELLKEFFFYFLNFDFSRVMLLYTSSSIPTDKFSPTKTSEDVFEFGAVNIQDPFRHTYNVSGGAHFKSCRQFLITLLKTCEVYQNDSLWKPQTENWGLCSLFQEPIKFNQAMNEWNRKRLHSIHLPLIPDGAKKLKNILEYGLLFHCTEFCVNNSDEEPGSKTLLTLQCKAHHKTWQGRDFHQNLKSTENCILEREHLVSKELIDHSESKRKVLCEFQCMCLEIRNGNESKLVVKLNFVESKFPPTVAIFLKEFLPRIFRKV